MARRKTAVAENLEQTSTAAEEAVVEDVGGSTVCVALNRAAGITFTLKSGKKVSVAGNAVHLKGKEMGMLPTGGAFGLTTVEAADWEEIKTRFAKTALFKSGRIFAMSNKTEAIAAAKEKANTRNGLEPASGKFTTEAPKGSEQ